MTLNTDKHRKLTILYTHTTPVAFNDIAYCITRFTIKLCEHLTLQNT